jgi:hypothetical protein
MDLIKNQKYSQSFIEFITKHFAQLLFIPILLGGIIQVIRLYIISPQAVRFFSPSQAISDGIFYLTIVIIYIAGFLCLIIMSLPQGILMISKNLDRQKKKDDTDEAITDINEKRKYKLSHETMPLWLHITIFLLIIYMYYLFFVTSTHFLESSRQIQAGAISFAFNFMLSINLMRFIYYNEEYYFIENTKTFLTLNISLCLICTFLYSTYSINQNNFASNFRHLKDKYCCQNSGTIDIIYFNDKFIFIRRNCESEQEEIIVEKIDSLFENK